MILKRRWKASLRAGSVAGIPILLGVKMVARLTLSVVALGLSVGSAFAAQSKEEVCSLQGDIVSAIQEARLDRVPQDKVVGKVMAANPEWPQKVEGAMPGLVNWIYEQKRRDLKKADLGDAAQQQCLDNWEQIKTLYGS